MSYRGSRVDDIPRVLRALLAQGSLCGEVNGFPPPLECAGDAPSTTAAALLAAEVEKSAAAKAAVVYDLDALRSTFTGLLAAFPPHFKHALAVKSAPMAFVVDEALAAGLGCECASFGEAAHALARGCNPASVVFDSPAKTVAELRWALEVGIAVNADSLAELERIDGIVAERAAAGRPPSTSTLGLRVNPIIRGGAIGIFAVSEPDSKFGHPLHSRESRAAAVGAFVQRPWLTALHCHVGSAGTSLPMLARGAAALVALADEIDGACAGGAGAPPSFRVTALDIGGGLACSGASDEVSPTFAEYAAVLQEAAPGLFSNTRRAVVTEFGRALTMKSGWVVAQVEYAKEPDMTRSDQQSIAAPSPSISTLLNGMVFGFAIFSSSSFIP